MNMHEVITCEDAIVVWYGPVEGGGRNGCPEVILPLLAWFDNWMEIPDACELPGGPIGAKSAACGRRPTLDELVTLDDPAGAGPWADM